MVTDPGDPFGTYYAEILRAEGLNEFDVTDIGSLDAGDAGRLPGRRALAQTAVTDAQATVLTNWVQGGGNLIAMRPDPQLAGLLGLGATTGTRQRRLPQGRHRVGRRRRHHGATRCSSTAPRTCYAGDRRDAPSRRCTRRATAHAGPAVTLRSVGAAGGQAAAFTYDLARSIVYTRQGNPAWAGQKRDGQIDPIRSDDLFFGAKRRLGRPQQGRDPAGRRAAAPAGEPHHADEPRPHAAAALLVPAARREGRGRPDRRRPRPAAAPSGSSTATSRRARPAARSPTGSACGRPPTSIPARAITDAQARGLPGRRASRSRCTSSTDCADFTPALARGRLGRPSSPQFGAELPEPVRAADQPHALHRLERLGERAEGRARARHPLRHQLLLLARRLGPGPARHVHRLGLPDALRRRRRLADRRLPGGDAADRRVGDRHRPPHPASARRRARLRRLLRRLHGQHAHRRRRQPRRRRHHRRGPGARRAGGLGRADARLARRPQRLVVRRT